MYDSEDDYDSDEDPEFLSSEEDMEFLSDQQHDAGLSPKAKQSVWGVIDKAKLAQVQDESLAAVQGILGCSRDTARKLLTHFQWNKEALFGTLADRSEEAVYQSAGVISRSEAEIHDVPSSGEIECGCCFCDVPVAAATTMECGHTYCNDCWQQHFKVQISEGNSRRLPCMAVKCGAICDDRQVRKLLRKEGRLLRKYEEKLLDSYIEDNKSVRWCPSVPHCGCAIQVDGDPQCEPVCQCGCKFCFQCGLDPHSPCTCEMWKQWQRKCSDDSETANWLNTNTKPCPKCQNQVEKNGGCNLVVCRCGQAFCWLCGASTGRSHTWETISGHSCGRYKEDVDKKINEAQRNLQRYIHYNSRWEAHVASQKLEAKQVAEIREKIAELEDNGTELKDYTWLSQALQQLFCARRILGNSYVSAFYFFGNDMFSDEITPEQNDINKSLFEDQQACLETEVERLSKLIETPVNEMVDSKRFEVINSTANVDKRLIKLFELIENDFLAKIMHSTQSIAPYKGESTLHSSPQENSAYTAVAASSSEDSDAIPACPSSHGLYSAEGQRHEHPPSAERLIGSEKRARRL
ncbi:hypothetical protein ABBQ32_006592 [Trebouxia sp. C0010 RCD-2024]